MSSILEGLLAEDPYEVPVKTKEEVKKTMTTRSQPPEAAQPTLLLRVSKVRIPAPAPGSRRIPAGFIFPQVGRGRGQYRRAPRWLLLFGPKRSRRAQTAATGESSGPAEQISLDSSEESRRIRERPTAHR